VHSHYAAIHPSAYKFDSRKFAQPRSCAANLMPYVHKIPIIFTDGLWAFAGVAPNPASVPTIPAVQRGRGQLRDKRHPRSIRGLSVLVAVAGLMLVQRLVPATRRKEHNDVAGFIYAVLGVAYAVMLGLMIIAVWESFVEARNTVDQEATELAEIAWLAYRLPEPEGTHIQELARSYAEVVVEEELALMREGQASPRAWAILDEIRLEIENLEVRTVLTLEVRNFAALSPRVRAVFILRRAILRGRNPSTELLLICLLRGSP
jgi:hypothetical protein